MDAISTRQQKVIDGLILRNQVEMTDAFDDLRDHYRAAPPATRVKYKEEYLAMEKRLEAVNKLVDLHFHGR